MSVPVVAGGVSADVLVRLLNLGVLDVGHSVESECEVFVGGVVLEMNRCGGCAEIGAWFQRCLDKTQDGNDAVSLVTKKGTTPDVVWNKIEHLCTK